jgi:hypothetical protein
MKKLLLSLFAVVSYTFGACDTNGLRACRNVLLSYSNKRTSCCKATQEALTITSDALRHIASQSTVTHIPSGTYTEVPVAGRPRERALCFLRQGVRQVQTILGPDATHLSQTFLPCAERVITEALLPRPDLTKPELKAALAIVHTYAIK